MYNTLGASSGRPAQNLLRVRVLPTSLGMRLQPDAVARLLRSTYDACQQAEDEQHSPRSAGSVPAKSFGIRSLNKLSKRMLSWLHDENHEAKVNAAQKDEEAEVDIVLSEPIYREVDDAEEEESDSEDDLPPPEPLKPPPALAVVPFVKPQLARPRRDHTNQVVLGSLVLSAAIFFGEPYWEKWPGKIKHLYASLVAL